jgi:sterol desaturase/sphingolipid hydroxylase (fatty acid hydroxylase superfamily)
MKRLRWLAFGVGVGVLFVLERARPLRNQREPGAERVARNIAIGLIGAVASAAGELPIVAPVQRFSERRRLGLLRLLRFPPALRVVAGFLLLDYTLYWWHRLNHRSPFLWRFHAVHHLDRDLDSSTGFRFHFGELALAAGFRAAQVLLLGVDRSTLAAYYRCLLVSIVFHHSNLALPEGTESALQTAIVTPRMHGIHHASLGVWMNTNYASLLPIWDRLHGTMRLDVPQPAITIGIDGHQAPADVTLERSLALPFAP